MDYDTMIDAVPSHFGFRFTKTVHYRPSGPTDPANTRLPTPLVVLITGAGKGIGAAIALAYATAGASGIIICSRTQSDLDTLSQKIHCINKDIKVLAKVADILSSADLSALAKDTEQTFGRLDIVVANAGIISSMISVGPSERRLPSSIAEDDTAEDVLSLNLIGTYKTAKIFLPLLQATEGGAKTFIAITSASCHDASTNFCPLSYNISKLGITRLVEGIHVEQGPKPGESEDGKGVLAYSVYPGAIWSETQEGRGPLFETFFRDEVGLCGGWLVWLTKERRAWLSGRYLSVNWDVEELEARRGDVEGGERLMGRMVV